MNKTMKMLLAILLFSLSVQCQTVRKNPYYCKPPIVDTNPTVKYGYIYNFYAVSDARNIAPAGWHVPTQTEWYTLITYLGESGVAGGKLKETGTIYWSSPNTGATNEVGFNARGAGHRATNGTFGLFGGNAYFLTSSGWGGNYCRVFTCSYTNDNTNDPSVEWKEGHSIRYIKDNSTYVSTVTGNDGTVYPCVDINGQIWTSCNSAETKFRNGDLITKVTDNTDWSNLTTEGYCAYNNDESNVFE